MHKPIELGYRMPAEWEKHEATWLAWPFNKSDWPGKFAPIPWVYAEIIKNITRSERARVIVSNTKQRAEAKEHLKRSGINLDKVDFYIIPMNRGWLRDSGPIFIKNAQGKKAITNWKFNAWAKYPNHKLDNKIPEKIDALFKHPRFDVNYNNKPVVMEGGAIDVNGKGLLIATEECLLSKVQERNRGFKRDDYEKIFADYLGIKEIIWLEKGIVGDDTHGHIDDITRFVNMNTVVTVVEKNKKDANYDLLQKNLKILQKTKLNVIELPMPEPITFERQRLPASYANFLITNSNVLVPVFNDKADSLALNTLQTAFKRHEIIPIYCKDLVWGLGTIHCMTQHEPA